MMRAAWAIAQLGGRVSHARSRARNRALKRLAHRGGVDADGRSGDGAGLLIAIPRSFFRTRLALTDSVAR